MKRFAAFCSLLALTVLVLAPAALAQEAGTIYGTVTNAETGEALPGVNVMVPDAKRVDAEQDGPCWNPPRRRPVRLGATTNTDGVFQIAGVPAGQQRVIAAFVGFKKKEKTVTVEAGTGRELNFVLEPSAQELEDVTVTGYRQRRQMKATGSVARQPAAEAQSLSGVSRRNIRRRSGPWNTESYDRIEANEWRTSGAFPLSTFSIDVDAASYSNVRRMLCEGRLPPKDAVRIEEMVNYFDYDYEQPTGDAPFSIATEVGEAPWNEAHRLVHVGLQGRELTGETPPSNLVFLLDVSGSMRSPRKLGLLKQSFRTLTERLGSQDRVAIVVYAGGSGLVLESTPGDEKGRILEALRRLRAGGSTAGAAGIRLAYEVAQEHFAEGGNNRVILATDGDFNVGPSSDAEMERLIEEKRESGVFLTTLGFGTGNLKDSKMEALADAGNGNYFYIDSPREGKKVLGRELTSTLFTIAKDVKIQVEFNPAEVARYRLIGYVNRLLDKEDFADDSTDAGELGAGHTVTALYEIVPADGQEGASDEEGLRYQTGRGLSDEARSSGELMQVRLRYKAPDGDTSRLLTRAVPAGKANAESENFAFSSAVAGFGMLLRDSEYKSGLTSEQVLALARDGRGDDPFGYRKEFIGLVERFQDISSREGAEAAASRR